MKSIKRYIRKSSLYLSLFCFVFLTSCWYYTHIHKLIQRSVPVKKETARCECERQEKSTVQRSDENGTIGAKFEGRESTIKLSDETRPLMVEVERQESTDKPSDETRPLMAELEGRESTDKSSDGNMSLVAGLERRVSTVKPEVMGSNKTKKLLWYDVMWKSMSSFLTKAGFAQCKYKNCEYQTFFTSNDSRPNKVFDADAILIQSAGIFNLSPPPRRDENQVFIIAVRDAFYCSEERQQSGEWLGLFNWTITYRLDSDFVYKYANILERENKTALLTKNYDKIFEGKTNKAVWYVSHCTTSSRREHYVREMQKAMEIDIFGGCGKNQPWYCRKEGGNQFKCIEETVKKYKFYLAFENNFVEDYITEKVYRWFNEDMVVVVRGGANYSRIVPPGTVVDASEFESPVKLAQYLTELAQDKERYIEILKRKDMYYATHHFEPARETNCKLCEYLNNLDLHRKQYSNIAGWWMKGWRYPDMRPGPLEGWPLKGEKKTR